MASKEQKQPKQQQRINRKGLFAKDLPAMMYGFGDLNPGQDAVNVMEELLVDHIQDVCLQAQRVSTNKGKIKLEDFKFALRNDSKKLARIEELLYMQEVISRARGNKNELATFGEDEEAGGSKQNKGKKKA